MKKMIFKVTVFISFIVAFLGAFACFNSEGGMGVATHEEYLELQALIDANGGHLPDDDAAYNAIVSKYEPIEYDDGTVTQPGQQVPQSSQPAAQPAQKTETAKTETTQTTQTETTETPEEPEEPEHEHSYRKEITTMPTCTEDGVATYTCDECGDSYTESIPATGHDEGEWSTEVEPTCTTAGKEVLKCTRCGEILDEREIPALGHTPGEWEVTKQADWIHDGERIKKCTVCGEILETEVIPANHVPLYIIGGCILAVIILIVVIVAVRKRGKSKKVSKAKK